MESVFYALIAVIAWFSFKIYLRYIRAETSSSEDWFRERLPFSSKTIAAKKRNERKGADARHVAEYDPEADYESVEVFYKEKKEN